MDNIKECIVLAGGLGTRLRGVIGERPKCMALVNGKPFLEYLLDYLHDHNIRPVLSLGYGHDSITYWLRDSYKNTNGSWVIEKEPLGTGGGIQLALKKECKENNVLVINGDTFFDVDINALFSFHNEKKAATTLALKPMQNFDRYGVVNINEESRITSFEEKAYRDSGLINGGVYIINKEYLLSKNLPEKFSFEKDYLEAFVSERKFYGYEQNGYFIDIGIPQDYDKAQQDFKTMFE